MAKDRFKKIYSQGSINVVEVLVDTETGVNYILTSCGAGGSGITPLLDKDGKIVVTPIDA
ncbi:MAG: DUF6440 family protein [Hominimerdicola sp.]